MFNGKAFERTYQDMKAMREDPGVLLVNFSEITVIDSKSKSKLLTQN